MSYSNQAPSLVSSIAPILVVIVTLVVVAPPVFHALASWFTMFGTY